MEVGAREKGEDVPGFVERMRRVGTWSGASRDRETGVVWKGCACAARHTGVQGVGVEGGTGCPSSQPVLFHEMPHPDSRILPGRCAQNVQNLLLIFIQIGTSVDFPHCMLLLPSLRFNGNLVQQVISLCYTWADQDPQPLVSMSILAGLSSACSSADLPASRNTCMQIRVFPHFRYLLRVSLGQVHSVRCQLCLSHLTALLRALGCPCVGEERETSYRPLPFLGCRLRPPAAEPF